MTRTKDFGGFISETFGLLGRNAAAVAVFVAVLGGLNSLGLILGYMTESDTLAGMGFGFNVDPADGLAAGLFQIAAGVLSIVASYFLLAKFLEGEGRLPVRETRIWAYVGVMILTMLGMMVGFLLLFVPGIILLVRWSATSGYLIERRLGLIESIAASWDATRGSSWPIFFVAVVLFIGLAVAGMAIGSVGFVIGSSMVTAVISSFAEVAGNAVFLAFGIAIYLVVDDNSGAIGGVFD